MFRLATAIIALHALDDAWLQPQPGTTAGDHVFAGLVPLVLLALAAWRFGRTTGGRRAALMAGVGVFGVVGGIEAVHYSQHGGPTGDDFTGLASLAAGIALLGLGAVTTFTQRSRMGGLPRKVARRAGYGVAGLVTAAVVVFPLGMAYVVTHTARPPVGTIDLGAPAHDVTLRTSDGLKLAGSYVPSRNGAAVIAFPGRKGPQKPARVLVRHGYGVLVLDRRGEGESEGDPNGFGWQGERDISAAIDFLRTRPDVDERRIGGLGLSVGGEMMIQHAAEHDDLAAVVTEGAGTRSVLEDADMPGSLTGAVVMGVPITAGVSLFSGNGVPPRLRHIIDRVSPAPLMLIYAKDGQGGTERNNNPELYRAAREPKAMWEVQTGDHMDAITEQPREYERRVVGFFDRALLRGSQVRSKSAD